ncbi:MAG: anaerobic sulfatase maturase [Candidatus Rokubacteria bacterium]|nr:anaerobic sulfatase maturase [Candidatus Rokubacteria bacterium]
MPASREFQVMVKPGGAVCNLDCRYCYYLAKDALYPAAGPRRMPDDLLETYIVQHLGAAPTPLIAFAWHGGEPTLLGLDYFRRIVALQRAHPPEGRRIVNTVQTNGTRLDEAWARFFAAEGFYVGLSLDGPAPCHDAYRRTKGDRPTHRDVVRALRLLQRHGVPCDVLCVVHAANVGDPLGVYRFFKDVGVTSLQFLPLVERAGADPSERTPAAGAVGDFLCAIFDEWLRHDLTRLTVQVFDEALRTTCGVPHALCIFRETCGDVPVVEHTGDFYCCDHYVDESHRLGDIRRTPLATLLDSPAQRAFGDAKRDTLPAWCRRCEVLAYCNGGCPKDRFLISPDGEPGLNYLCAGFRRFFVHARPYLERLAAVPRTRARLEEFMVSLRGPVRTAAGRNERCPCGSGRKYKRCCLGRG